MIQNNIFYPEIGIEDNREGERIRTGIILLGKMSSKLSLDKLPQDINVCKIAQARVVDSCTLLGNMPNADIVLFAIDMNDGFVNSIICEIEKMLHQSNTKYVKIIVNRKKFLFCGTLSTGNIMTIEDQENLEALDIIGRTENLLNDLCFLIDNEINTIRTHEEDFSALITLKSFFSGEDENLYLYNISVDKRSLKTFCRKLLYYLIV